jgi:hypothetical protein
MIYLQGIIFIATLIAGFATTGSAQSAGAPPIYEIKFDKGAFVRRGTVQVYHPCPENGPTECGNGNSTSLSLAGTKGERLKFVLTSESGTAVFSIIKPDGEALVASTTGWTGSLPSTGDYRLYVYATKGFTKYTFKVSPLGR